MKAATKNDSCGCQVRAEAEILQVLAGERPIHQCSGLVQTIYFLAEGVTLFRLREKASHLWETIEVLESALLKKVNQDVEEYRFVDFKAFVAFLKEGWRA